MTAAELFLRATAWLAFAAYLAGTAVRVRQNGGAWFPRLWCAGAMLLVVHILAAFHVRHGWSHAAAWADTARQTREVTGLDWGGGVWFNYALVLAWLADAGWWLRGADLPRAARLVLDGFYAFMWFNAAVVFVPGPARWAGLLAFGLLGLHAWRSRMRPPS